MKKITINQREYLWEETDGIMEDEFPNTKFYIEGPIETKVIKKYLLWGPERIEKVQTYQFCFHLPGHLTNGFDEEKLRQLELSHIKKINQIKSLNEGTLSI